MAPNFSIILSNWVICAWRLTAICFTAPIVTSLFSACTARWFDRTTVLSVQCCSRCGSLSFLDFALKTADVTLMEANNHIECFLLCALTDLFSLSLKILALYCRVSGQVPLSLCLFKDLIAPSAWLIFVLCR